MSSQTVWLPTALYTALIRLQMDDFTTTECLNAVFGESEYNQAHKRRYGLVYRNLMRLVDAGFLERRNVDDVRSYPSFVKTPLFHDVNFQEELIGPATQGELEVQEVQEVQECQAAIAEYNMLQTNFPALEITIDNALRNTSQKYRDLRGRLAAVEKVMRALESNESAR